MVRHKFSRIFGGPGDGALFVRIFVGFPGSRGWGSFCEVFPRISRDYAHFVRFFPGLHRNMLGIPVIAHKFVKDFSCTAHFSIGLQLYRTFFIRISVVPHIFR